MDQGAFSFAAGFEAYGEQARPLIDQIPAAVVLFDLGLRCVMVNARWRAEPPFAASDPVGRDCEDLAGLRSLRLRRVLEKAIAGKARVSKPARVKWPYGSACWFRSHVAPWRDAAGIITGAMLVCENVSAELEETLRSKVLEEDLSLFIENADGFALCMLDDEGRITIWNDGAERLFRWSEAEIIGQSFALLFEPPEQAANLAQEQLEIALRTGSFRDRG